MTRPGADFRLTILPQTTSCPQNWITASTESALSSVGTTQSSRHATSRVSFPSPMHMKDYCVKLMQGSPQPAFWNGQRITTRQNKMNDNTLIRFGWPLMIFSTLVVLYRNLWIPGKNVFPIAYNIVVYKDPVQVERLLHAIYRPKNHYCIHVNAKVGALNSRRVARICGTFGHHIQERQSMA